MSKSFDTMDAILAQRFAPFDFSAILVFQMLYLLWMSGETVLPRFKGNKDDHPAEHLLDFHEIMHQLGIYHEYVLMKMFMYSLEGDAHEWYISLSPSSISSLKEFHTTFHNHCKKYFPAESLFEHCCEEFESSLQHREVCSCNSEEEMEFVEKENLQESIIPFFISNEQDQDSNT
jgi:hypothetical protein